KMSNRDGLLQDIQIDKLFCNIQDVLNANIQFWKQYLLPIKRKLEQIGTCMNPSDLKTGFIKFDHVFKPYLNYVLNQKICSEYFKQKLLKDELFQQLISWIESNFTSRLSFPDLTIKPLQRLTKYKLLLEAIQRKTSDHQQRMDLQDMIQKVETYVNRVNTKLNNQEQEERLRQISERIGQFDSVSAPPEILPVLQEYYRDTSNRLDLLRDMPLFVRGYKRSIIQQGPMKMKDSKDRQDVYCYLFTDMFLITKGGKKGDQRYSNNKILKPPIRIDRIDVKEYVTREPNAPYFIAIVFSEYNLIEGGYLFQTNLSKQWIENIRTTKNRFQILLDESKMKLQHAHLSSIPTNTTNTSHQNFVTDINPLTVTNTNASSLLPSLSTSTLPSLSNFSSQTSLDESRSSTILKLGGLSMDSSTTDYSPKSKRATPPLSEVNPNSTSTSTSLNLDLLEQQQQQSSDESKPSLQQQTRRNSRGDRRNNCKGRYHTADEIYQKDETHDNNNSDNQPTKLTIPIQKQHSSIRKRMSWNNGSPSILKNQHNSTVNDSQTFLSSTNSFRSVQSSTSGVSSNGSFLFSADDMIDESEQKERNNSQEQDDEQQQHEEDDYIDKHSSLVNSSVSEDININNSNNNNDNDSSNRLSSSSSTLSFNSTATTLSSNNVITDHQYPSSTTSTNNDDQQQQRKSKVYHSETQLLPTKNVLSSSSDQQSPNSTCFSSLPSSTLTTIRTSNNNTKSAPLTETSLIRSPFQSVKKWRSRPVTNNTGVCKIYEDMGNSRKSPPSKIQQPSLDTVNVINDYTCIGSSGNESDYDNHHRCNSDAYYRKDYSSIKKVQMRPSSATVCQIPSHNNRFIRTQTPQMTKLCKPNLRLISSSPVKETIEETITQSSTPLSSRQSSILSDTPSSDDTESLQFKSLDDLVLGDQNEIVLMNDALRVDDNDFISLSLDDNHDDDDEDEDTQQNEDDDAVIATVELFDEARDTNINGSSEYDTDDDSTMIARIKSNYSTNTITNENSVKNIEQSDISTVVSDTVSTTNKTNEDNNYKMINNSSTSSLPPSTNVTGDRHPSHQRSSIFDNSSQPSSSHSANFIEYRKETISPRKLLDIRSHLLLNTTLDAT
ncbi:unnamed protein product, partial [Didymodactylos carnosus]